MEIVSDYCQKEEDKLRLALCLLTADVQYEGDIVFIPKTDGSPFQKLLNHEKVLVTKLSKVDGDCYQLPLQLVNEIKSYYQYQILFQELDLATPNKPEVISIAPLEKVLVNTTEAVVNLTNITNSMFEIVAAQQQDLLSLAKKNDDDKEFSCRNETSRRRSRRGDDHSVHATEQ